MGCGAWLRLLLALAALGGAGAQERQLGVLGAPTVLRVPPELQRRTRQFGEASWKSISAEPLRKRLLLRVSGGRRAELEPRRARFGQDFALRLLNTTREDARLYEFSVTRGSEEEVWQVQLEVLEPVADPSIRILRRELSNGSCWLELSCSSERGDEVSYSWDSGDSGDSRDNGDNGDSGDNRKSGDNGNGGDTGSGGDRGDNGDSGDNGDNGNGGDRGDNGDSGDSGNGGDNGDSGDSRDNGDSKDSKDSKDNGDNGDSGDSGPGALCRANGSVLALRFPLRGAAFGCVCTARNRVSSARATFDTARCGARRRGVPGVRTELLVPLVVLGVTVIVVIVVIVTCRATRSATGYPDPSQVTPEPSQVTPASATIYTQVQRVQKPKGTVPSAAPVSCTTIYAAATGPPPAPNGAPRSPAASPTPRGRPALSQEPTTVYASVTHPVA